MLTHTKFGNRLEIYILIGIWQSVWKALGFYFINPKFTHFLFRDLNVCHMVENTCVLYQSIRNISIIKIKNTYYYEYNTYYKNNYMVYVTMK